MKEHTSENRTNQGPSVHQQKIMGGCQSESKKITHDSYRDLPLVIYSIHVLLGYYQGTTATAVLMVRPKKKENLE